MSTRTEKSFDCLAFKQRIQEEVYEQIKDLTAEQRVRYFNEAARSGPFAKFWSTVPNEPKHPKPEHPAR